MKTLRTVALIVVIVAVVLTAIHFAVNTDWIALIKSLHSK